MKRMCLVLLPILALFAGSLTAQPRPNQDERCHQDYTDEWVCADDCGDQFGNGCYMAPLAAGAQTAIVVPRLQSGEPGYGREPRAELQCYEASISLPVWTTVPRTQHREDEDAVLFRVNRRTMERYGRHCRIFVWNVGAGGWYWIDYDSDRAVIDSLIETPHIVCFPGGPTPLLIEGLEQLHLHSSECAYLVLHVSGKIGILPMYELRERIGAAAQRGVDLVPDDANQR